jgi:hypothetical protein
MSGTNIAKIEGASRYIYVIGCEETGLFKIGITKSLKRRIFELSRTCVFPLKICAVFMCGMENAAYCEKFLHDRFSFCRTHGEWFKLGDQNLDSVFDAINVPVKLMAKYNPKEWDEESQKRIAASTDRNVGKLEAVRAKLRYRSEAQNKKIASIARGGGLVAPDPGFRTDLYLSDSNNDFPVVGFEEATAGIPLEMAGLEPTTWLDYGGISRGEFPGMMGSPINMEPFRPKVYPREPDVVFGEGEHPGDEQFDIMKHPQVKEFFDGPIPPVPDSAFAYEKKLRDAAQDLTGADPGILNAPEKLGARTAAGIERVDQQLTKKATVTKSKKIAIVSSPDAPPPVSAAVPKIGEKCPHGWANWLQCGKCNSKLAEE